MKKKINPELLKEELKKFKFLSEYDFYTEKKSVPEYKEIILGDKSLEEADEEPENKVPSDDIGTEEMPSDDIGTEEMPLDAMGDSDEVEIDVTSLVKGSEEAKKSADVAKQNTETLLKKLDDLETRMANMSSLENKIGELEKEFVKRNPTPVEKLEMRSLDSYPFNQKLSDYWSKQEGFYDVTDKNKEYVLTKDDVNSTYSDASLKNTFSIPDEEYDEEDI